MRMRRPFLFTQTAVFTGLLLALAPNAAAECVGVTPKQYRADVIFSGTFVKKEVVSRFSRDVAGAGLAPVTGDGEEALRDRTAFGLRLTFDVQQVWKGPSRKTMIVYQLLNPDSMDIWKPKTDYLILATRLSDQERSSVFLGPGEEAFGVQNCSGGTVWTADVQRDVQRALGRGRRPE
jgi:hypothetical protein